MTDVEKRVLSTTWRRRRLVRLFARVSRGIPVIPSFETGPIFLAFFSPLHSLVPCDAIKILDTLRIVHEFPPRHTIFISYEIKRVLYQRIYFFPPYKAASNRRFIRYCIKIRCSSNLYRIISKIELQILHDPPFFDIFVHLPRSFHIPGNRFTRLSPTFQHWKNIFDDDLHAIRHSPFTPSTSIPY